MLTNLPTPPPQNATSTSRSSLQAQPNPVQFDHPVTMQQPQPLPNLIAATYHPDAHELPPLQLPQQQPTQPGILQAILVNPHNPVFAAPTTQPAQPLSPLQLDDIRRLGWSSLPMRSTNQDAWARYKATNHEILRNINNRLINDGLQPILPNPYANRLVDARDTLWEVRNDMDCWFFARGWLDLPGWRLSSSTLPQRRHRNHWRMFSP